jgi:hypothetical protein
LKQVEEATPENLWKMRSTVAALLCLDSTNLEEGICAPLVTAL